MKIIYLHQYFATPESNAGTRSYEMAKRFINSGHNVTFITTSAFLTNKYQLKKGWNKISIEGITLHVLHMEYSNKISFLKRIYKFIQFSLLSSIKILKLKGDVVFATSTPLTIAIPGLIYSKVKKVPMVFEVRDLWPELPIAVGVIKNPVLIRFTQWFEKFTYNNSKRLIGLSPGMCDGIINKGIDPSLVSLATNSCDTELFDVDAQVGLLYKESNMKFLGNRKLVVYTGTFGLINNVGYLPKLAVEMLEVDPTVCFIAIGDGMEKESIIKSAKALGVFEKNLYFMQPVPKTEIVKILSAASLSLSLFGPIPQMWHNSANKLFDSLASGTPVAINYNGWQREFIDANKCGLVLDILDVRSSAVLISSFLGDDERLFVAKESCRTLAYSDFSRDEMARRVELALQEAIND